MSDMEVAVKPIILDLINGTKKLTTIKREERLLLARWSAKTSYVLNSSANYPVKVPKAHLAELRDMPSKLPWSVRVVGSQLPQHGFSWFQSTVWQLAGPAKAADRVAAVINERTYKIALQLGTLALITTWASLPGWTVTFWTELHQMLWPLNTPSGWIEGGQEEIARAPGDARLAAVTEFINLTYIRSLPRARRF